jgi:lipoprotein NlpI
MDWVKEMKPKIISKFELKTYLFSSQEKQKMTNESLTQRLIDLNEEIGNMEQQGSVATDYFTNLLSEELIFRRASGKVDNKDKFIEKLQEPSPFTSRHAEDVVIELIDDRHALVNLIVTTKKADGSKQRFRNIRLFSHSGENFILEFWYNYELTSL